MLDFFLRNCRFLLMCQHDVKSLLKVQSGKGAINFPQKECFHGMLEMWYNKYTTGSTPIQ